MLFVPNDTVTGIFLALRGLRAIRILSKFAGTRVNYISSFLFQFIHFCSFIFFKKLVVRIIFESLQIIPHIFIITVFFWAIFAIAGLQLFVGQYYYCNIDGVFIDSVDDFDECKDDGYSWDHWPSYFANILHAFIAVVRGANVNFPDSMIHGVDVAGEDNNPIRDNHPEYALFWVCLMVVCSWFIIGLFLGSIADTFKKIRERENIGSSILLTERQREWIQLQRVLFSLRPKRSYKEPDNRIRKVNFC